MNIIISLKLPTSWWTELGPHACMYSIVVFVIITKKKIMGLQSSLIINFQNNR